MYIQSKLYNEKEIVDNMVHISDPDTAFKELELGNIGDKKRFKKSPSNLSMEIIKDILLDGLEEIRFSNLADGSIITLFDKTPFPKYPEDVVCPHFVELKWANGCKFDCAWCYLNGTFRFRPMGKKPYIKDLDKIKTHLTNYFEQNVSESILNSGELSDSLVSEGNGFALSKMIIPLFKTQNKHKLLILTKSANVNGILRSESKDSVIISYSLNSLKVAKRWEKGAPDPRTRILKAKQLQDAGYDIRLRIDPIVPIENWEDEYMNLIDLIFKNIYPERITIGSLRGLQSTINYSHDKSWVDYLDDRSNWGKKIGFETRFEMYNSLIQYLKKEFRYNKVALCKETIKMWDKLGLDYKKIRCNCIT